MAGIHNQCKGPVSPENLKKEPQTSRLGYLKSHYQGHPSRGLTPIKLAAILEDAESGLLADQADLAEDMEEKDAHLFGELQKRKLAVLKFDWYLAAPPDANVLEMEEVKRLESLLHGLDLEDLLLGMAGAILPGFACIEIEWDNTCGQWQPLLFHSRPGSWFMTAPEDRNIIQLVTPDGKGEPLRKWGWLVHRHMAKSGYVSRGGLVRILAWPYLFRNLAVRDFAEFLEICGHPLRLGIYPSGSSREEKANLMQAVIGLGHASVGIIPETMRIEFREATCGISDPYLAMVKWAEKTISKAILGGTLGAQTDGSGSYALGKIHEKAKREILKADLRQIANTLTRQLVEPLAQLNTRLTRYPKFKFDVREAVDFQTFTDAVCGLVKGGVKIPARWVREKLFIPEASPDEEILLLPHQTYLKEKIEAAEQAEALKARQRTVEAQRQAFEAQRENGRVSSMLQSVMVPIAPQAGQTAKPPGGAVGTISKNDTKTENAEAGRLILTPAKDNQERNNTP